MIKTDLSVFSCEELYELRDSSRNALRLVQGVVADIPLHEIPFLKLKAIDEINKKIDAYDKEISSRCFAQGKVKISSSSDKLENKIFVSYSNKDKIWLEKLKTVWTPFEKNYQIVLWSDEDIRVGEDWFSVTMDRIHQSTIAILLVTNNFLSSKFINKHELPPILKSSNLGRTTVFWIPISYTAYEETELKHVHSAYDPRKPLDSLSQSDLNEALVAICKKIKKVLKEK